MKTFGLYWLLSYLLWSPTGQLALALIVLWYLDNRYFGVLAALWAPVTRSRQIAALRQSVSVNPSDVRSLVELGEHSLRGGRPQAALEYLDRAIARGEDSARALFLSGAAKVRLGRHVEGQAELEAALAKKPDVAYGEPYIYLLEQKLATEGASSPAIEELVTAFERFDSVEVLTRAGLLCSAAGRASLARRLFEEAIRNYGYVPKKMRRLHRRWVFRARWGLMQTGK